MYSFSKNLFETDKSTPMTFNITKCKDHDELKEYIEAGGGHVDCLDHAGPYTVVLLDDESKAGSITDRDIFSSEFIWRSCMRGKILPLKSFRLNPDSRFPNGFDPADVLYHNITWQDAASLEKDQPMENTDPKPQAFIADSRVPIVVLDKLDTPVLTNHGQKNNSREKKSETSQESHDEDMSSSPEEDFPDHTRNKVTAASGPRAKTIQKTAFTTHERNKIVEYIVKHNEFHRVKGVALWQRMSLSFTCHSWQSLKNHFVRKILPAISSYKLPPDVIARFKNGASHSHGGSVSGSHFSNAAGYSNNEDLSILAYVRKHRNSNTKISGNQFWKDMKKEKLLPGRTWQSVRERYLKRLRSSEDKITSPTYEGGRGKTRSTKRPVTPFCKGQQNFNESEDDSEDDVIEVETSVPSSPQRQSNLMPKHIASSSKKDEENNPESIQFLKRKRKLFLAEEPWETPSKDYIPFSPVSVKRMGGRSQLDVAMKKYVAHDKYLKKKMKISAGKANQKSSHVVNDSDKSDSLGKDVSPSKNLDQNDDISDTSLPREKSDPPALAESQDLFASSNEGNIVHSNDHQVLVENPGQSTPKGGKTCLSPKSPLQKEKLPSPLRNKNKEDQSSHLNNRDQSPCLTESEKKQLDPAINRIILPEWPSNFTAEKIVFVESPSSENSDHDEPSSPNPDSDTDCELEAKSPSTHDSENSDFDVWSDYHWRGVDSKRPRCEDSIRDVDIPSKVTGPRPSPLACQAAVNPTSSKSWKFVKPVPGIKALQNFRRCSPSKELFESNSTEIFDFLGDVTIPQQSQSSSLMQAILPDSHTSDDQNIPEKEQETEKSARAIANCTPNMVDKCVQTDPVQIIPVPIGDSLVSSPQRSRSNSITEGKACTPVLRSATKMKTPLKEISSPSLSLSHRLRDGSPASKASGSPNAANRCARSSGKKTGPVRKSRSNSMSPRSCGVHSPKYSNPPMP